MYRGKFSTSYPKFPNLKILLLENKNKKNEYFYTFMIRQLSANYPFYKSVSNVKNRIESLLKSSKLIGSLRERFLTVPKSLKNQSSSVLRVWAHQCEYVLAQRIRRGQQMFCLYTKLWEERALLEFIKQFRTRLSIKGRDFLIAAIGVTSYDWAANRISEGEIRKHLNEFQYVYTLKDKTLCDKCEKNSRICQCVGNADQEKGQRPKLSSYDDWKVFITKSDIVVWRRLHSTGCYEYKVYGSYFDVTAEDFLNVQIDIGYRKLWDTTAVALKVVEADHTPSSNSDIIYWEMLWPKLFANRDYVFNRRYLVDHKNKTLFLVSKSTKHPSCPKDQTKYRIEDYWSYMVIKPYTDLDKPGIEFSLTYYDNPGVNIPASVTTWVAMRAMPDFLERLREASKKYRVYCKEKGVCQVCNIMDSHYNKKNPVTEEYCYYDENIITDNTIYEPDYHLNKFIKDRQFPPEKPPQNDNGNEGLSSNQSPSNIEPERQSYWRSDDGETQNEDQK